MTLDARPHEAQGRLGGGESPENHGQTGVEAAHELHGHAAQQDANVQALAEALVLQPRRLALVAELVALAVARLFDKASLGLQEQLVILGLDAILLRSPAPLSTASLFINITAIVLNTHNTT